MTLVSGVPVVEWVAAQLGAHCFAPCCSVGVGLEDGGEIRAGVVYESWNGASVVCHIAIRGRVNSEFYGAIFRYAFQRLTAKKIVAPVSSGNARMLGLAPKMGFREEGRLRQAAMDGDIILFSMTPEQCRFLGERYGEKHRATA